MEQNLKRTILEVAATKNPEKKRKKNSPKTKLQPQEWPDIVWKIFDQKISNNRNSKSEPYYKEEALGNAQEVPLALINERCHNPSGAAAMTIIANVGIGNEEFQLPLHRLRFYLSYWKRSDQIPDSKVQASHLCLDRVNTDGRGSNHCCNPAHMVNEDDQQNKSRQRCQGWIWIHPYGGHEGNYWYPSCLHQPPCIRFTPKTEKPSQLFN